MENLKQQVCALETDRTPAPWTADILTHPSLKELAEQRTDITELQSFLDGVAADMCRVDEIAKFSQEVGTMANEKHNQTNVEL